MWETQVQSLDREDHLEKGMATHSSVFPWWIPWTEEPGSLQFLGSQKWHFHFHFYSAYALGCVQLSDPMDCSLLGSSAHGISQARILEWVAISFSIIVINCYLLLCNTIMYYIIVLCITITI